MTELVLQLRKVKRSVYKNIIRGKKKNNDVIGTSLTGSNCCDAEELGVELYILVGENLCGCNLWVVRVVRMIHNFGPLTD